MFWKKLTIKKIHKKYIHSGTSILSTPEGSVWLCLAPLLSTYLFHSLITLLWILFAFILIFKDIALKCNWALVVHTCNPSYSGGRDQENRSSKPAQANSLRDPISKNPSPKRAGGVVQGVGPEFKPQYRKKKLSGLLVLGYFLSSVYLEGVSA
jgi:hypothetical protein